MTNEGKFPTNPKIKIKQQRETKKWKNKQVNQTVNKLNKPYKDYKKKNIRGNYLIINL